MAQHELDISELDAITALAGIDWEPDDPQAVTLKAWAEHVGLSEQAAELRLTKLVRNGDLRTFKVRRRSDNGSTHTVRVWKRIVKGGDTDDVQ
jgi:hypothetical protein